MGEEQVNKGEENPADINTPDTGINEWDNDVPNSNMNPLNEQPPSDETQNQSNKTETILVEIQKQKWSVAETINAIIALGTIAAVIISAYSLKLSNDSLNLTKASIDSANKSSQQSFELSKRSADAATRATEISDSNYNLSKEALYKNDSTNKQFYEVTYQTALASQKSAQVAEKALIETKNSYDFSRESSIKEIRAYVVGNGFNITRLLPDSSFKIESNYANVGKTPAYKIRIAFGQILGTSENGKDAMHLTTKMPEAIDTAVIFTLGANQHTSTAGLYPPPINKKDFEFLKRGILEMYVAVYIIYEDIFGKEYFTHIFSKYDFNTGKFLICRRYNDAN